MSRSILPWYRARRELTALLINAGVAMSCATMAQPIFLENKIYERSPPEMNEPAGHVAELIGKLSNESTEKRRGAGDALLKMGAAVEPQLRWAREHGENGGRPLSWPVQHVREGNKWVQ